jgi:hypothetical protein
MPDAPKSEPKPETKRSPTLDDRVTNLEEDVSALTQDFSRLENAKTPAATEFKPDPLLAQLATLDAAARKQGATLADILKAAGKALLGVTL